MNIDDFKNCPDEYSEGWVVDAVSALKLKLESVLNEDSSDVPDSINDALDVIQAIQDMIGFN